MFNRGVIHVFIGAPVIAPSVACGKDRAVPESKGVWKDVPFTYNVQRGRNQQISADQVLGGGSTEKTTRGESVCGGYGVLEGPYAGTCVQESDTGQKIEAGDPGVISDLVSSTELCHITHNAQRPSGKESDDHQEYFGEALYPHVIEGDVCRAVSAETEFLTVLTSSQLAVTSLETDVAKATYDPVASTSESVKQSVLVGDVATGSASPEGFTCSSDLFTDTSDDELDQKSLQSPESGEKLDQKLIQSQKREELDQKTTKSWKSKEPDQKSILFQKSCEDFDQMSLQAHSRGEADDQKSLRSHISGEELDQKSLQSHRSKAFAQKALQSRRSSEGLDQKSIQYHSGGQELDQKSLLSHTGGEVLNQKSLQSHRSGEELDQTSLRSFRSGKELDQKSLQFRKSEKDLLHVQGDSTSELNNNVDYVGSASSKRKKALSGSSPSSKHEQQSKKSKPSVSPVKFSMQRHTKHRQQTPGKTLTLLMHCLDKKKEYDVMVVVLQPSHVKEIKVKSGANIGSTIPLATMVVTDQSEVKRELLMWRAAAFWGLALLPGEIIVLTNVSVCEDRWRADIVLQSSYRSKLTNLGSCSTLLSGDNSYPVELPAIKELLDHICKKHRYLSELSPRQPQRLEHIQFLSLADLQPELLLHSLLKVNSISVLKESTYSYKGLQQNKIILSVEQVKGHTSALVLWGACVSWCDQIRLKRDHVWIFKYLICKKNIISGDLELHTTPWSSCECLFDDDQRAVDFRKKYNLASAKQMSLLAMIEDRYSGEIQVKGSVLQMEFPSPGKHKILLSHKTSISDILKALPDLVYTGCGKCKRELSIDENNVYEQCYACLPFNQVRVFYRPAQMTIMSDHCCVGVQVPPDILENNVFLNIAPNLLPRVFPSSADVTYGTIVADLCHSLLAQTGESFVFTIRSQFMLDENSIPLEEDFQLLDFHLDL